VSINPYTYESIISSVENWPNSSTLMRALNTRTTSKSNQIVYLQATNSMDEDKGLDILTPLDEAENAYW